MSERSCVNLSPVGGRCDLSVRSAEKKVELWMDGWMDGWCVGG